MWKSGSSLKKLSRDTTQDSDPSKPTSTQAGKADAASAGVGAGVNLLGGLLDQAAQEHLMKQQVGIDASNNLYQGQITGQQALGEGQRKALAQIMQNYRGTL